MKSKQIPVISITGFLGSGKTTLINHLLANSRGTRIGVIVNDFGSVNIDALLVARQTDELVELASGCICCMMDENSLNEPLSVLAHAKSKLDVIIIEASGLAEPRDLARKVITADNPFVSYGGLIYIIDTLNFAQLYSSSKPQVDISLHHSDLIILNKFSNKQQETLLQLQKLTKTPILTTHDAQIDPRLLFDLNPPKSKQLALTSPDCTPHLHDNYTSFTFSTKQPLCPHRFNSFAKTLPPAIYRAKGSVYFGLKGYEQKFLFQKVGSHLTITHHDWPDSSRPATELVFVGTHIDKPALKKSLTNLIDPDPDDLSPDNIIHL